MMQVFREEEPLPNTPLPQLIPWGLLRAIAIIQLYIEERFIEPPREKKMPMSLLFHQTLSVLASSGELTPRRLAERVLALPPFEHVTKEDYKVLILSMLEQGFIAKHVAYFVFNFIYLIIKKLRFSVIYLSCCSFDSTIKQFK